MASAEFTCSSVLSSFFLSFLSSSDVTKMGKGTKSEYFFIISSILYLLKNSFSSFLIDNVISVPISLYYVSSIENVPLPSEVHR